MMAVISEIIAKHPVVLFMYGSKAQPYCMFSDRVVEILDQLKISFFDVNVLEDEALERALKKYSRWPTLPQLYINGVFMGGCDVVTELCKTGEMKKIARKLKLQATSKPN